MAPKQVITSFLQLYKSAHKEQTRDWDSTSDEGIDEREIDEMWISLVIDLHHSERQEPQKHDPGHQ
jgi:hypothetical protein